MTKKEIKARDARIQKAYLATCSGIQIPILDMPKVWKVGIASIERGADDATLGADIRSFVETIRVN